MSIGYRSRRKSEESMGYRTRQRLLRGWRRRRRIKIVLGIFLSFALISFGALFWLKGPAILSLLFRGKEKVRISPLPKPVRVTFLIIGAQKTDSGEEALGLILMSFDPKEKKISGFSIPPETFVEIPGHGFEKISEALTSGIPILSASVGNFLGISADHYLKLDHLDFERIVKAGRLNKAFDRVKESDLNQMECSRWSKILAKVPRSKINIVPLPVKPISVGQETYFEPQKDEIEHLVKVLFGREKKRRAIRAIVLNGCGEPGVAGEVAQKLIENGYKVVQTKNAESFDFKKTQIVIYRGDKSSAERVKDLLGVGVIVSKRLPQDLADIAIIVGKDYKQQPVDGP